MSKNVYRTANGHRLDLGQLMLKNENVRAVGNMNVNARGDMINAHNKTIQSRNEQVQAQYNQQVAQRPSNVIDDPVYSSAKQAANAQGKTIDSRKAKTKAASKPEPVVEVTEAPIEEVFEDIPTQEVVQEEPVVEETKPTVEDAAPTGLAAAIAKSRSVTQEEIKPAKTGVKRI